MTSISFIPYLPVSVHPPERRSHTCEGIQTFAEAQLSLSWGIDHFSSAGILTTPDQRAAGSNSIDRVLARASTTDTSPTISNILRLLLVSSPRNRPILNRALDMLPPILPGCKITAIVPVASTQEAEAIPGLLHCLAKQSLNCKEWEAVLYLNMADREPGITPKTDDTEKIINAFKRKHPHLHIHVLKVHYSQVQPMGAILHDASCAVLARHLQRWPNGPEDHLLLKADADQVNASQNWVKGFVQLSVMHPQSAAFQGCYIWDRIGLGNDPAVLGFSVCEFAIRSYLHSKMPELGAAPGGGPNICVRAGQFALCGYNPSLPRGADYRLMVNLEKLGPVVPAGAACRIETSSRRTLIASQLGHDPHTQWYEAATMFSENNEAIRRSIPTKLIAEWEFWERMRAPNFHTKFERWITNLVNGAKRVTTNDPVMVELFNRLGVGPAALVAEVLVDKLGMPATYQPAYHGRGSVVFSDSKKLTRWLLAWRQSLIKPLTS